ncbi:MAG: transporter substrate-binding domain-containing protein [Alphaproteobacteria bacterium]
MRQYLSWPVGLGLVVLVGLVAALFWWQSRPAPPKDPLAAIKARGAITIGVRPDAPPFSGLDAAKNFVGYEPDIGRALAASLGVQAKFVPVDVQSASKLLLTGAIDVAIVPRNGLDQRNNGLRNIEPGYYASGLTAVAVSQRPLSTWEELKGERVCGLDAGTPASRTVKELGGEFVGFPDVATGLKALAAERCRAFVGDEVVLATATSGDPEHQFSRSLETIDLSPWMIGVRAADQALGDALAAELVARHRSGYFEERALAWRVPESPYLEAMRQFYSK